MKRILMLVGILGMLLLSIPAGALAGSTCQAHNQQLCSSDRTGSDGSGSASPTSAASASTGSLPFTGLDVVLLVAGGSALLGVGLVVRRLSRKLSYVANPSRGVRRRRRDARWPRRRRRAPNPPEN